MENVKTVVTLNCLDVSNRLPDASPLSGPFHTALLAGGHVD